MLMFPDNSYGHIYVTSQGTLQIRGVQKEDAGYYVCSALSVAGSATIRAFLQVTSVDDIPPPIIQIGPANQTIPIGSMAMLPCRAIGNPIPRIRWYKDGMPLQTNQRLIIVQSGLKIDSTYHAAIIHAISFDSILVCNGILFSLKINLLQICKRQIPVYIPVRLHLKVVKHLGQPHYR